MLWGHLLRVWGSRADHTEVTLAGFIVNSGNIPFVIVNKITYGLIGAKEIILYHYFFDRGYLTIAFDTKKFASFPI